MNTAFGWPLGDIHTINTNKILVIIIYLIFIYMYANVVYTNSRNQVFNVGLVLTGGLRRTAAGGRREC